MALIDVSSESILTLAQACRLLPPGRGGGRVHLSTVLRWILDGAKAPGGNRVKLDGIRLGGRWLTSKEALQRFAEKLRPSLDGPSPIAPRSPGSRQRASTRAARELEEAGI